jgi:hypothetical protein
MSEEFRDRGGGSVESTADQYWYRDNILSAIHNKDLDNAILILHKAYQRNFDVLGVRTPADKNDPQLSLYFELQQFLVNQVQSGIYSPEERIKYFNLFLPLDYRLASDFLTPVEIYDEDLETAEELNEVSNPLEIYWEQCQFYEMLMDQRAEITTLFYVLQMHGYFDRSSPYILEERIRERIIDYAKEVLHEHLTDTHSVEYSTASDIITNLEALED